MVFNENLEKTAELRAKVEEPDREPELHPNFENEVPGHRETIKAREMSDVKLEDGQEKEVVSHGEEQNESEKHDESEKAESEKQEKSEKAESEKHEKSEKAESEKHEKSEKAESEKNEESEKAESEKHEKSEKAKSE